MTEETHQSREAITTQEIEKLCEVIEGLISAGDWKTAYEQFLVLHAKAAGTNLTAPLAERVTTITNKLIANFGEVVMVFGELADAASGLFKTHFRARDKLGLSQLAAKLAAALTLRSFFNENKEAFDKQGNPGSIQQHIETTSVGVGDFLNDIRSYGISFATRFAQMETDRDALGRELANVGGNVAVLIEVIDNLVRLIQLPAPDGGSQQAIIDETELLRMLLSIGRIISEEDFQKQYRGSQLGIDHSSSGEAAGSDDDGAGSNGRPPEAGGGEREDGQRIAREKIVRLRGEFAAIRDSEDSKVLSQHENIIHLQFTPLEDRVRELGEEVSRLRSELLATEVVALERELNILIFASTLRWAESTVSSYEGNNRAAPDWFKDKETFLKTMAFGKISDIVAAIKVRDQDLASRMEKKVAYYGDYLSKRGLAYATYYTLKETILGIGKSYREYPEADPGFYVDGEMYEQLMKGNFYPQRDPELMYKGERSDNPLAIVDVMRIKLGKAIPDDNRTVLGTNVLKKDGEWAYLESKVSLKELLFMAIHEIFSSKKFPSLSFQNYHRQGEFETYQDLVQGILPELVDTMILPCIVEDGAWNRFVATTRINLSSLSPAELEQQRQEVINSEAVTNDKKRVKDLILSASKEQIKQVIILYLTDALPQAFSEGGPFGISDGPWYANHLYYPVYDFLRKTASMIPLRILMLISPKGFNFWKYLDESVAHLKSSERYNGLFGALGALTDLPANKTQDAVTQVVTRQKNPQRFSHFLRGALVYFENLSMADDKSRFIRVRESNDGDTLETTFSARKAIRHSGFATPRDAMLAKRDDGWALADPDTDASIGRMYTAADMVDANGLLRVDLWRAASFTGSVKNFYAAIGPKINQIYKRILVPKHSSDLEESLELLSELMKEAFYGAASFPILGKYVMAKRYSDRLLIAQVGELTTLATLMQMILEGKPLKEVNETRRKAAGSLDPVSMEVIHQIINAAFAEGQIVGNFIGNLGEEAATSLRFEN